MDKIAVVILNYNGLKHLKNFLPKVIEYSKGYKVIVADNCSTDDSVSWIKISHPEVELILLPENGGYSKGYNDALKQVQAEYYVLLNNDIEVTPQWIDPILKVMDAHRDIAACQPKILSYFEKNKFEYAGAAGGFIDSLGYPFCRGRIFDTLEEDKYQYDQSCYVFWATGACLFIRSEIYHKLGGLDEDFFAHMEEIDLCWRINNAGYKIGYSGDSKVYHVGGGTLNKSNPRKTYLNFRNSLFLLYKNTKTSSLLWMLPIRFILDWVAALRFLIFNTKDDFVAVLNAHKDFLRNCKRFNAKRRWNLNNKKISNNKIQEMYKGLIIWDYFGKKKNFFWQLSFNNTINCYISASNAFEYQSGTQETDKR